MSQEDTRRTKPEPPRVRRHEEVPLSGLKDRTVALLGYGNQGRAHALNLRDSGIEIRVGVREGVGALKARQDGFDTMTIEEATKGADLVIIALPDETQPDLFESQIRPNLQPGASIGFLHGFAIHHEMLTVPEGIGIVMIAPKGPGVTLRDRFVEGGGIPCLLSVHTDSARGDAEQLALGWAAGLGCGRAAVLDTTFANETETDLFGEQVILCGGLNALVVAAYETLVNAGYPPELAYIECCHEVKQVADLIQERGLAGMRAAISNTAEFGAYEAMKVMDDDGLRTHFSTMLENIRNGTFAARMVEDHRGGGTSMNRARMDNASHPIEETGRFVRSLMPLVDDKTQEVL
jgi:ketol-acid reductoisomerase